VRENIVLALQAQRGWLLVAAGEKLDRLLRAGGTDPQLANKALGDLVLFTPFPAGC
jgi:hypothetical protein